MKTRPKAEIEAIKKAAKAMHAFAKTHLYKDKTFNIQLIPGVIHRFEVNLYIDDDELNYEVESEKHIGTSPLGRKIIKEYAFEEWYDANLSETKEFKELDKEFIKLLEDLSKVTSIDKYALSVVLEEAIGSAMPQTEFIQSVLDGPQSTSQIRLNSNYIASIRSDGSVKVGCQNFAKKDMEAFFKVWTETTSN